MRQILSFLLPIACIYACVACGGSKKSGPAEAMTGDEIPTMITRDVTMLVSDSGVIKYRAITPNWTRFGDEAKEPYQFFPEGIRIEQVENEGNASFAAQQTIVADTAYNWENQQLWHLKGHVEVTSIKGELFQTEELFWDMREHTVYNETFIHIERTDNILEGIGFDSNDSFTKYEIRQINGIFPAKEQTAQKQSSDHQNIK